MLTIGLTAALWHHALWPPRLDRARLRRMLAFSLPARGVLDQPVRVELGRHRRAAGLPGARRRRRLRARLHGLRDAAVAGRLAHGGPDPAVRLAARGRALRSSIERYFVRLLPQRDPRSVRGRRPAGADRGDRRPASSSVPGSRTRRIRSRSSSRRRCCCRSRAWWRRS